MRYEDLDHPLSNHARRRAHQRAARPDMIELVLELGQWFHDHDGSMTAWFPARCLAGLPASIRRTAAACVGLAVTIASGGRVVTVQWAKSRKPNWRGGR